MTRSFISWGQQVISCWPQGTVCLQGRSSEGKQCCTITLSSRRHCTFEPLSQQQPRRAGCHQTAGGLHILAVFCPSAEFLLSHTAANSRVSARRSLPGTPRHSRTISISGGRHEKRRGSWGERNVITHCDEQFTKSSVVHRGKIKENF